MPFAIPDIGANTFPCIDGKFVVSGCPSYRIGQDGIEAVLRGMLAYDDLDAFVDQIQPPSTIIGSNMVIQYGAPFPGRPNLRVTDIKIDPLVDSAVSTGDLDSAGFHKCSHYMIVITYRFGKVSGTGSGTNNPDPAPFLIHRWSIGGQVLSLDNRGLMWDDIRRRGTGGTPDPFFSQTVGSTLIQESHDSKRSRVGVVVAQDDKVNAHLLIPHIEHEITWPRVPKPPFSFIKQAAGKVNRDEMNFQTGKIPPECLLFTGAQIQQTAMSNGQVAWELVYRFSERQVKAMDQTTVGGWNHYFRSSEPLSVNFTNEAQGTIDAVDVPPVGTPPHSTQGFFLDGQNNYFSCTNLPGFYRLELTPGNPKNVCIREMTTPSGVITIDLATGYLDELAIMQKFDMRKLFGPDV